MLGDHVFFKNFGDAYTFVTECIIFYKKLPWRDVWGSDFWGPDT